MSATASDYHEDSDSEWSITAVFGSERAHSVSSRSGSMGAVPALSCTTQDSKTTAPTAPSAPQKDIDTTIPLAILMHTAQCHNHHTGLAAGDAPPKEPMHKAQQDEPEDDTAIPLATHTAGGHHHNDYESTVTGSSVPHQPTSSFNLGANSFAPFTAIGSLFTLIRSLPTLLACALPIRKKDVQPQGQQQVQAAGQEQMTCSSGIIKEEQLGSPSPSASHADPDHGHASDRVQSVASLMRTCPGAWRWSTPGPVAVPALSFSPVGSESSGSDTTLRPDSPTNHSANAVDTATAPPVLQTTHHDVGMDSEENHHGESDSEDYHDAPSNTHTNHPTSPPADSTGKSSAATVVSLYERRSETVSSADPPALSPESDVPIAPTSPLSTQSRAARNPAAAAAAAAAAAQETPPASPPSLQPMRKRGAEQYQDQTAPAQMLSGFERFRARKRAKRAEREDTAEFQLQVRVPVVLRQGGGVRGGRTRGLQGSVWEEWGEEKEEEEGEF